MWLKLKVIWKKKHEWINTPLNRYNAFYMCKEVENSIMTIKVIFEVTKVVAIRVNATHVVRDYCCSYYCFYNYLAPTMTNLISNCNNYG